MHAILAGNCDLRTHHRPPMSSITAGRTIFVGRGNARHHDREVSVSLGQDLYMSKQPLFTLFTSRRPRCLVLSAHDEPPSYALRARCLLRDTPAALRCEPDRTLPSRHLQRQCDTYRQTRTDSASNLCTPTHLCHSKTVYSRDPIRTEQDLRVPASLPLG